MMRLFALAVFCLHLFVPGCARSPVARPAPGSPAAEETPGPPFDAVNPLRGPGLYLDGLVLLGDRGKANLAIAAFEDGREIVLFVRRTPSLPADWLDACPRKAKDPREPQLLVQLEGLGDVSRGAVFSADDFWTVSIPVEQYLRLSTVRLDVCGQRYELKKEHAPHLAPHARLASERANRKNQTEAAYPGACQQGDAAACREAGALVLALPERRRLYERACSLNDYEACSRLADMLLQGKGGDKDPGRAFRLLSQGCQAGYDGCCLGASRMVIQRPSAWPAPGAEGRYRQGAIFAARACELGGDYLAVSCLLAAELHASGFGVPADPQRVGAFAGKSCQAGDYDKACRLRPLLSACASGEAGACVDLAEHTRKSRYRGLRDDGTEAVWRLAACKRGHTASCAEPGK